MAKKLEGFPKLTADQVKGALRKRHPATAVKYGKTIPGPWTTLEEYQEIDFLAISANKMPASGSASGLAYPWIGYEVKISRSDMRTELLKPNKRFMAKRLCNQFFFAVPKGMLTKEEKDYREPEWSMSDFQRTPCIEGCRQKTAYVRTAGKRSKKKSKFGNFVTASDTSGFNIQAAQQTWQDCRTCEGRGYSEKSKVEKEAPTLWIPKDVGLIEVDNQKSRIVRKAPITKNKELDRMSVRDLNNLIRWTSLRPDPRHKNVIEDLSRKKGKQPRNLLG